MVEEGFTMNTAQRIRICKMTEKINKQKELSNRLGINDSSRFRHDKNNKNERRTS